MFQPLVNVINDIALGPQNRKVKEYLGKATRTSVLGDIGKVLSPRFREIGHLRLTFDKYCTEESSAHQKYWTEESFHSHVRSTHSADIISDAAIAPLWRSFYFYAYHPFPPNFGQDAKVDFDAFRRALLLTTFQCDNLLGTRELDWYWRQDAAFFRKASFARMFRSFAVPEYNSPKQQEVNITSSLTDDSLSDAMDVLVMIGPQFIHAVPSEPQLESVARKLFTEGPLFRQRLAVRREDVSVLVHLLLCLRLEEKRWGMCCHFGDIVEAESGEGDLTEVLVDALTGDDSGQMIPLERFRGAIDLMPNLLLRFHQLWAVLFQPPKTTDIAKLQVDEVRPTNIGGMISLFAPHINVDNAGRQRPDEQDTGLTLELLSEVASNSQNTSIFRLSQVISDHSSAFVVLFIPDAGTSRTVIGAYFPAQPETAHVLFQLQPKLRILRWIKPNMPRGNLITADKSTPFDDFVGNKGSRPSNDTPYWLGDPYSLGTGIQINPKEQTVTLTNSVGGCYTELPGVSIKGNLGKASDVTIQHARMEIFTVASTRMKKD